MFYRRNNRRTGLPSRPRFRNLNVSRFLIFPFITYPLPFPPAKKTIPSHYGPWCSYEDIYNPRPYFSFLSSPKSSFLLDYTPLPM